MLARDMPRLLVASVSQLPNFTQLPMLLLAHHVQVDFDLLRIAMESASRELFVALADSVRKAMIRVRLFRHAREINMTTNRRSWVYRYLLQRGLPKHDVSKALLISLEAPDYGDLSLQKLLLKHGAAVKYLRGRAFQLAIAARSVAAVKLLSQYIVDDGTANVAFNMARRTAIPDSTLCTEVYRCLLQWHVSPNSLYDALVEQTKSTTSDHSVLQLLLAKGADPNAHNAECLVLAFEAGAEAKFRTLSEQADPELVLRVLLDKAESDREVVRWFKICLEKCPPMKSARESELLLDCLQRFPRGVELLKLLLDSGFDASGLVSYSLCEGWPPEMCTILIWAIFRRPMVSNRAILMLLAAGRDSGA